MDTMTKTFRNTKFTRRDYEGTNVVACQGATAPADHWVECDESVINGLDKLWIQDGRRFFGYL